MGCDLAVYRARVGIWAGRLRVFRVAKGQAVRVRSGDGVALLCAAVLATLLVIGGVEQNPGPATESSVTTCPKCDRSERRLRRLEAELTEAQQCIRKLSFKIQELEKQSVYERSTHSSTEANNTVIDDEPYKNKVKVLGDSMLRHSGGVCKKKGADVSFFPGINVVQMKSVVERAQENEAVEVVLVHVGTNVSKRQPIFDTVNQCVELGRAVKSKFKNARIVLPGVMQRRDVHIG